MLYPRLPITNPPRIALWVKVLYTLFVAFHLSVNLPFYGPKNYLWFCDIGVLTTLLALWIESPLVLGITAIAILGTTLVWTVDLFWRIVMHRYLLGMSAYIFNRQVPVSVRLASTFHLWVPGLLLWMLWKLGYDRRALKYQTFIAIGLLIFCRIISPPPPAHTGQENVNINFVYGNDMSAPPPPQPAWEVLGRMIVWYWIIMYLPTHVALCLLFHRTSHARANRAGVHIESQATVPLSQ